MADGESTILGFPSSKVLPILYLLSGISATLGNQAAFYHGVGEPSTLLPVLSVFVGMLLVVAWPERLFPNSSRDVELDRKTKRQILLLSATELTGTILVIIGIVLTGSGLFQVVYSSIVISSALLSKFVLHKTLSGMQWMALLVIMIGLATTELMKPADPTASDTSSLLSGEKTLGVVCTVAATLIFSCVYIGAEYIMNRASTKPSERQMCLYMGIYGTAIVCVYEVIYTLPRADHLVVEQIEKTGGDYLRAAGILVFLTIVSLLQHVGYFYLLKNSGAVTTGVIQALRAVCVFVFSSALYCSSEPSQCITSPKLMSTVIVVTGVLIYSFGARKIPVPKSPHVVIEV